MPTASPTRRIGLRQREERKGAAVVEFAVVAPLLLAMVFAMVELGRAVMVTDMAVAAAREGARKAALTNMTASQVQTWTSQYLTSAGIPSSAATITVSGQSTSGGGFATTSNLAAIPQGLGVQVAVAVDFSKVTWLPANFALAVMPKGAKFTETATMRKETY